MSSLRNGPNDNALRLYKVVIYWVEDAISSFDSQGIETALVSCINQPRAFESLCFDIFVVTKEVEVAPDWNLRTWRGQLISFHWSFLWSRLFENTLSRINFPVSLSAHEKQMISLLGKEYKSNLFVFFLRDLPVAGLLHWLVVLLLMSALSCLVCRRIL